MSDSKIRISWSHFVEATDWMCAQVADALDRNDDWHLIALARGGLVPATILSHKLNIPELGVIGISSYTGEEQTSIRFYGARLFTQSRLPRNILIVDDLVDTGLTLKAVKQSFATEAAQRGHDVPNIRTAVVFEKERQHVSMPDFVGQRLPDRWLVLPYEVE